MNINNLYEAVPVEKELPPVDKTEKDTLKEILDVFQKYKLQVKFKKGTNYNFK